MFNSYMQVLQVLEFVRNAMAAARGPIRAVYWHLAWVELRFLAWASVEIAVERDLNLSGAWCETGATPA